MSTHRLDGPVGNDGLPPTRDDAPPPPPRDELDALLREWHDANATQARAGRDRLLAALADAGSQPGAVEPDAGLPLAVVHAWPRRLRMYSPLAAAAAILLTVCTMFLLPQTTPKSFAGGTVMCPDGGRLDALDPDGNVLGPCELKHTDVKAEVSGFFSRVTLRQQYHNPHAAKIEAVYTFPMSHRAAVDWMTMTIGDRVIVGEVKERQQARHIYDAARAQGRVASLLEQERPNIFTQSVANIEPGASIDIEISYVEILEPKDGVYSFEFPTVVGPRYIPGAPTDSLAQAEPLPMPMKRRAGLVLLAPATVKITAISDNSRGGLLPAQLGAALASAVPTTGGMLQINDPASGFVIQRTEWHRFTVEYPDGSAEPGVVYTDCTGTVNGRWFYAASLAEGAAVGESSSGGLAKPGANFAPNTNQVPDASKVTPMPVRPPTRAGHDLSISVTIDTGGPSIRELASTLHEIVRTDGPPRPEGGPARTIVSLKNKSEIPNRDFILSWKTAGDTIQESTLAHTGKNGNFLSLILQPPARVEPEQIVPRELIFVLDTSGSMNGYPIEKSKELAARAIDQMRPGDTFNIITFAGDTHILWNQPRPNTPENRAEAQKFVASRSGGGGTEMMKAIHAALAPSVGTAEKEENPIGLDKLIESPGDGSRVTVDVGHPEILLNAKGAAAWGRLRIRGQTDESREILVTPFGLPSLSRSDTLYVTGRWTTVNAVRVLNVESARAVRIFGGFESRRAARPLRIVLFLTDAYVGNEFAILDAIKANRGTTRVFSFGIGNSVNRFLIDSMARLGGGEAEFVTLADDADAAVERLVRRIAAPVLANIKVEFQPAAGSTAKLVDQIPSPNNIPDLFDQRPLNLLSRYSGSGKGTLCITGDTAAGPYRREIALDLPAEDPAHDTVATLWARAKVDSLMNEDLKAVQAQTYPEELKQEVIRLGETFGIMTQYTSFVAVDKLRVTVGGRPRLVHIPIELPQGMSWEGNFGAGPTEQGAFGVTEGRYLFLDYKAQTSSFSGAPAEAHQFTLDSRLFGLDALAVAARSTPSGHAYGINLSTTIPDQAGAPLAPSGTPAIQAPPTAAGAPAALGEEAKRVMEERLRGGAAVGLKTLPPPADAKAEPPPADHRKSPDNAAEPKRVPGGSDPVATRPSGNPATSSFGGGGAVSGAPAPKSSPGATAPPPQPMKPGSTPPALSSQPSPTTPPPAIPGSSRERAGTGANRDDGKSGNEVDASLAIQGTTTLRRLSTGDGSTVTLGKNQAVGGGLVDYPSDWPSKSFQRGPLAPDAPRELSDASDTSGPIPSTVPTDWVAVRIAALVAKPDIDQARELAAKLAAAAPTYELGIEMHRLLSPAETTPAAAEAGTGAAAQVVDKSKQPEIDRGIEKTLPRPEPTSAATIATDTAARDKRIAELGAQAKARLNELLRRATLARKLDARLLKFADMTGLPTTLAAVYDGPWPEGATRLDGGVLLSVLVTDTSPATLAKLKATGFRTDQTAREVNVVVGVLPLGRLADLAHIEHVRRVEPTD